MAVGTVWELGLGDEVISTIREIGYEFPWTHGKLDDPAQFDRFRTYFGPDDAWPESPEFEALLTEIDDKGGFWLRDTSTGDRVAGVHVNHDGKDGVWFRTHR